MRVAIVGCGTIVEMHTQALNEVQGVQLVACCDTIEARASKQAKPYGATVYTDYETMLLTERLDAVHICTPHYLHLEMIERAVQLGIAVLTEKPPVITWEQWERFSKLEANAKSTRIGICFQNRYNPENVLLREMLQSGQLGNILGGKAMVTWSRSEDYYRAAPWRGFVATEGGGVLINQAIHTLDLLLGALGEPVSVQANISNYHLQDCIEVEDTLDAFLQYENGTTALFYATTAYVGNSPILLELETDQGVVRVERGEITTSGNDGWLHTIKPAPNASSSSGKSYWGESHTLCIQDFYRSLQAGTPYQNDIASVAVTMRTTLAIYEAARTHRKVEL